MYIASSNFCMGALTIPRNFKEEPSAAHTVLPYGGELLTTRATFWQISLKVALVAKKSILTPEHVILGTRNLQLFCGSTNN